MVVVAGCRGALVVPVVALGASSCRSCCAVRMVTMILIPIVVVVAC